MDHEKQDIGAAALDIPIDPMVLSVGPDVVGARLDKFLADSCPDVSRTRFRALIEAGLVMRGEMPVTDPAAKVRAGEIYSFLEPEPLDAVPVPENIPLDIVYEDSDLLVINKDADMVVHPAAGHHTGTLVNALLYHCGDTLSGIGGVKRPGIVHRLDRGTSGLMMVAKNDRAHQALSAQLQDRSLGRIYDAVVFKVPMPPCGTIDAPIGRHPVHRLKMTTGGKDARPAQTHYRVTARSGDAAARVECKLATGRTHQIRVHMASIGHPLVGDPLYGAQGTAWRAGLKRAGYDDAVMGAVLAFPRQALHAREIHFIHPVSGESMSFTAPPPDDFQALVGHLGL